MTSPTASRPAKKRGIYIMLLLVLVFIVLAAWFADVQDEGPYLLRNLLPPLFALGLAYVGLRQGARPAWLLSAAGFAIPAIGLSAYLHYAYSVNLNELFADASHPGEIFRFLPIYTSGAGLIGAAIGWIIGRNL